MAITSEYPFNHHPCYSDSRSTLWHRIHLPVAPVCNVKCGFCSHSIGSSCHTSKPGLSGQIMTPESAVTRAYAEIEKNPLLRIVAISGPGEPLANPETFETLEMIRREFKNIAICISTNGTLLEDNVDWLRKTEVDTITVSMSTASIFTASKIYEWARVGDDIFRNEEMGSRIVDSQLRGISKASKAGIHVKVNSILIPEINMQDMLPLAYEIRRAGAALQNIVPLVPNDRLFSYRAPTIKELSDIRKEASTVMKQFSHCKQCRSDVVGIPGCDRIL
ncbi:MAG: radical SAM protein [Candidatus Thorarchaeota archaeon]|nr:radical SAM protein [Candidatus Thorarchaeota archaeon]